MRRYTKTHELTPIVDFESLSDPQKSQQDAEEFSLRVIASENFSLKDCKVLKGDFRFRHAWRKAARKDSLAELNTFLCRVRAKRKSSILRLYFLDIQRDKMSIVGVPYEEGLEITFQSGSHESAAAIANVASFNDAWSFMEFNNEYLVKIS